jgi:hypothetical protein
MLKTVLALLAAAGLGGCAMPTAGLSLSDVQSLKIETVEVAVKPDGSIWWGKAEREFAEKAQAPVKPQAKAKPKSEETADSTAAYAALVESPEGKAYVRQKAADMLKGRLEQQVRPAYQGTRRVKLVVTIQGMVIPSAVQRVTLGGAPILSGTISIVDLKTGAEIAKTAEPIGTAAAAGNGVLGVLVDQALPDLEDRLMDNFANATRAWIAAPAPEKTSDKASQKT